MKKRVLKCHCGAQAVLRPASVVHGEKARSDYLYVCARYPACDSYVGVHRHSHEPLGSLADRSLRNKRIQTHKAFDRLWESGMMQRWQAYLWMEFKLGLTKEQAHIARLPAHKCDELIAACEEEWQNKMSRLAS